MLAPITNIFDKVGYACERGQRSSLGAEEPCYIPIKVKNVYFGQLVL